MEPPKEEAVSRHRKLNRTWWLILITFSALATLLAVSQIFLLAPFGFLLVETGYFYCLIALYISLVFIIFPASKSAPRDKIPWYDYILFFGCVGISLFFASKALEIIERGWEFLAPTSVAVLGVVLWFLVIEAVRRASGLVLAIVVSLFSFYPLFCVHMPGFLEGVPYSFLDAARYHSMSCDSILGIPMKVVGSLLIGFMLFGVALQATGGGKFFLNFASALVGTTRGGPAKVAVIASGLFGSMSGSVISNVVTTGSITIPTMKRIGYPATYAAAIESCASTGGVLMPPIMGAAAFIMASLLDVPYLSIIVCAAIPSILYYLGLLLQVDGYAARTGLKGMPKSEVPSLWLTLKQGWFYIFAFVILIYFLVVLRNEGQAPFYAIAILVACAMLRKETRFTWHSFLEFIASCGRFMAELTAILGAVGLIIGSLSMTGVAHAFSRELVLLAGGSMALLLLFGALTSFILGIGMSITACYIFLAIVLAPALIAIGLNQFSVHLFIMYWGMVSFITPPVALGAITAAGIAGSEPMRTGFRAMRLGTVIYFIPFFFVLNPALILQASGTEVILCVITAIIGVLLLANSLEGYLLGIGSVAIPLRILTAIGGLALMLPPTPWVPGSEWTDIIGGIIVALLIVYGYWRRRGGKQAGLPGGLRMP